MTPIVKKTNMDSPAKPPNSSNKFILASWMQLASSDVSPNPQLSTPLHLNLEDMQYPVRSHWKYIGTFLMLFGVFVGDSRFVPEPNESLAWQWLWCRLLLKGTVLRTLSIASNIFNSVHVAINPSAPTDFLAVMKLFKTNQSQSQRKMVWGNKQNTTHVTRNSFESEMNSLEMLSSLNPHNSTGLSLCRTRITAPEQPRSSWLPSTLNLTNCNSTLLPGLTEMNQLHICNVAGYLFG